MVGDHVRKPAHGQAIKHHHRIIRKGGKQPVHGCFRHPVWHREAATEPGNKGIHAVIPEPCDNTLNVPVASGFLFRIPRDNEQHRR